VNNTTSTKKPLVSVIVPTYNSAEYLDACLQSIIDQSYKNTELVVVDNNSTDDTKKIASKHTGKVYNKGPERSAQRNYGVKKSRGEYVLIIDSDMELTKDVVKACVEKAQSASRIKGIVIPEESFGEGFWAQCKKLERSFYVGVDWMEAARFFSRKTFDGFKGYDEHNTGTEDYDLPQRIEARFGKKSIARVDVYILHNEQKLSLIKTCKKKYYYAQRLERYAANKANTKNLKLQSSPSVRYRLFFSSPKKLLSNPSTGLGLLVMKTLELISGGLGYVKVNNQLLANRNKSNKKTDS
jgi:glycosyltransferase involved in cell wall biosynthesis